MKKGVFLLIVNIFSVYGGTIDKPPYIPCKLDDMKCITDMTQWLYDIGTKGSPELGIESFDPIHLDLLEANLGYVKFTLKRTIIEGFKICKVSETSIDSNVTMMHTTLKCPRLHLDGYYEIDGKLLNYPIRGKGDYYVDATKYLVFFSTDISLYKKDNNVHAKHEKVTSDAQLLGGLDFELRNLFGGNKELSDVIHKFGKGNPRLFASLMHGPFFSFNVKKIMKEFNKLFKILPITDLLQVDEKNLKVGKN